MVAVILEIIDAPAGFQRDQVAALAGLQEHAVDVGAVGDAVRLAETLHEFGIERHIGNEVAGQRVAHFLRRRAMGVGQHGVLEADFLQHAENIGPELDAGADFAEFRRLLEHAHRKTLVGQRHRPWPGRQYRRRRSERAPSRHSYRAMGTYLTSRKELLSRP